MVVQASFANFCQCNSRKLVAKIFGQCKSAATYGWICVDGCSKKVMLKVKKYLRVGTY